MEDYCPCLDYENDFCKLTNEEIDGESCIELAASCPCLMTLVSENPMDQELIRPFNPEYIQKAKNFYEKLE